MWRVVWRPEWLRAPVRFFLTVSDSSGPPLCRCPRATLTTKRVPGEVGLILMSAMILSLLRGAGEVDRLAGLQADVSLLVAVALAGNVLEAARLAGPVEEIHTLHLDLEHELHRGLHVALGRIAEHAEHVLVALLGNRRGLLRHVRLHQHVHQSFFIHSRLRAAVRAASMRRRSR